MRGQAPCPDLVSHGDANPGGLTAEPWVEPLGSTLSTDLTSTPAAGTLQLCPLPQVLWTLIMENSEAGDRLGVDISYGSLQAPGGSVTLNGPSSSSTVQSVSRPGVFPGTSGGPSYPPGGFQAGGWSPKQVNQSGQV